MSKRESNPFSFLSGFVENRNIGRVIAQVDELKDAGSTASRLLKWNRDNGEWISYRLKWHATRICVIKSPTYLIIATGPDGIVMEATNNGPLPDTEIDSSDDGPRRRGDIRDLRVIGEHVYVAGMGRQVYRRVGPGNWIRWDNGMVQPRGVIEVSGLNSIDGLNESSIYAAGFGGEIWHFSNDTWSKKISPTNVVLHRIRVVKENLVFAAGQMGVLIRGYGDQWQQIEQSVTHDDLWGMEWFRNQLYVACDSGLFVLTDNDELIHVDMGLGDNISCRHLHANDGLLWSSGAKHVCWTEDGVNWNEVTP